MAGFRKEDLPERADAYAAEADGLDALRPHIRVPKVLDRGMQDGKAFILLEQLELQRGGDWSAMGRMLARLHRQAGPRFGWHRDNYIGLAAQANTWHDDWADFFWNCRLQPQAKKAGIRLARTILDPVPQRPVPSLLHGDLWGGNAGFTADGPVVYDPAVYYGDREADLAMTELFGGFPRAFYDAYEKEWPLDDGYHRRKHVYNLYHLLNHLNLFGSGYLGQVKATLGFLGL
jgi:fructosamine-3-kinase